MTNRQKFIEEIENLLYCEGGINLSSEALSYFEEIKCGKASSGKLTEIGEKVLTWIRDNETKDNTIFSSKVIGEGLFLSPRIISGATRKLVADGYLYKEGKNPVFYGITVEGVKVLSENH